MKTIIVIPVYKNPDADELISLRRCCKVLSRYEMSLVCPDDFDTSAFHAIWDEYGLKLKEERFVPQFFRNIAGYNRLLLSEEFYARFAEYDYMLIYQPDVYVFEDRLVDWCNKGYDFVGAPIFGSTSDTTIHLERGRVGNGGLSLRRIKAYTDYFSGNKNVIPIQSIAQRIGLIDKFYTRWLVWILMVCGWRNKPKSYANNWNNNEDDFWSGALCGTNYELTKPSVREAMDFAFERFPRELYGMTKHLPFGVHAWKKYEYEEFWKDKINIMVDAI